jgi:hypothetical protein
MGGSGRDPVFQNDKGVVVRVIRRIKMDYSLYVSLLGDSFTVTLRDFSVAPRMGGTGSVTQW